MSRRQVLVQLDDGLIERLDHLARQQGTSRSDLLRQGAKAILQAAIEAQADRELVEAYRRTPPDEDLTISATQLAAHSGATW